ncbi:SH2 domain-containing protein [Planktothrix agardhii]|jgi:hypothetical protein|uniref:hypothetical protein n=1 Tax=Planktothrix agardhii TaxID=1160 RepID=UPI001D0A7DD1|nr:hypothetical protein [Planktothrix agardhii]MCB8752133.1 hypothetical protein [Planktothrix agardhii 1810]MCF3608046.1 hypothetical protein [Planktothrix agardhii 1033]
MSILYTCGNTNLNTVKLVAIAIKTLTERNTSNPISKIVLFSSPETLKDNLFGEQVNLYESLLGNQIRIEKVPLSNDGIGRAEDFTAVFKEDSLKYVDLTNGQKSITAQLYLTASLLRLENIYYISLLYPPKEIPNEPILGKHYEYVQLPPFTGIADISRLNYFDLIFYLEEIEKIFSGVPQGSFLMRISNDLRKSIFSFFQGDNFRSAVVDATTSSEVFINALLDFLISYPPAQRFSHDFGVNLEGQRDPLGAITFFFKKYSEMSNKKRAYIDQDLESIVTVPGLLTPLRIFRNMSAHAGISSHRFEANEVRVCINLALESFRCARGSQKFWSKLLER